MVAGATVALSSTKYFVFALLLCYFEITVSMFVFDFSVGFTGCTGIRLVAFHIVIYFAFSRINDRCSCIEATTLTSSLTWLIVVLFGCSLPGFVVALGRLSTHRSLMMV